MAPQIGCQNRRDVDALRHNWQMDMRWNPSMEPPERQKLYSGWKKAVTRTFNWLE